MDEKLLHKRHVTANYIKKQKQNKKIATQKTRYSKLYKKNKNKTKTEQTKHGWTALDIVGAGSSKLKGIQGRFHLLYPFRLNRESARP